MGNNAVEFGWSKGSPPLITRTVSPRSASLSTRSIMVCAGDRLGEVVVLIAISTRQVAPSSGNNMRENRMSGEEQPLPDHPEFTQSAEKPYMFWNDNAPTYTDNIAYL